MTTAFIELSPLCNIPKILESFNLELDDYWYCDGKLFVKNISQQDLDNAVKEYMPNHEYHLLESKKQNTKNQIDNLASNLRLKFITGLPGQSEVYKEKSEEAADFVAAGYPDDLSTYPFIQAEVAATNKSPKETADTILAKRSEWIATNSLIEQERIKAKTLVNQAQSEEEIDSILINFTKQINEI